MARRLLLLLAAGAALAAAQPAQAASRDQPATPAAQPPAPPGSPVCGPSQAAADEPQIGRNDMGSRYPAPIYFAPDFPVFADSDVNTTLGAVGGFGGIRKGAPLHHTPVIFVHGNQADAQNWLDTMLQFQQQAGYTMQEMYALSYNGLGNYYAGAPEQLTPSSLDQAYITQNSNVLANGGHGAGNEDNVPDLCRFVEEVQWYTGSRQVDIVAHSLGVTIARRLMQIYPSLAKDVTAFVGVAGGNHGTTVCTGLSTSYYGCDEIAPNAEWLAKLNAGGETYAPTRWMTVYNGAEGDPFFGPTLEQSPTLAGADNRQFHGTVHGDYHNDLRVDPPEVDTYVAFVLRYGQAGPGAAHGVEALATRIDAAGQDAETQNQAAPSSYSLAAAPLCIPGLTGTQDGCAVDTATAPAGSPQIVTATSAVQGLPNTAAPTPSPGPAGVPAMALAAMTALCRRRRQRMPVS
jgi:MYXO-CTERM domain-containing protein